MSAITLLPEAKKRKPSQDVADENRQEDNERADNDGNNEDTEEDVKKHPGIVLWACVKALDCQLKAYEEKLMRDISTSGLCISEVKVRIFLN